MAMRLGGRGSVASEINVTPMIDVLLVLLVIFMVVQQGIRRGLDVQVPAPERERPTAEPPESLVLEVEPGGRYLLNRQPIASGRLRETLAEVYDGRPRKVLFVKGSEALTYGEVVAAVDAARSAGVVAVGLVPRATGTGG